MQVGGIISLAFAKNTLQGSGYIKERCSNLLKSVKAFHNIKVIYKGTNKLKRNIARDESRAGVCIENYFCKMCAGGYETNKTGNAWYKKTFIMGDTGGNHGISFNRQRFGH